jgi:hypothetical protein
LLGDGRQHFFVFQVKKAFDKVDPLESVTGPVPEDTSVKDLH